MEVADQLEDDQHGLELAPKHVHVSDDEGDVEQRHEVVDELEED